MSNETVNKAQEEGKTTYQMKDSLAKRGNYWINPLTALDIALLTRAYGRERAFDPNFQADDNDELELTGNVEKSQKAKSFGIFSWLGGLGSEKIDFTFNGTPIKGRAEEHQVRGGAVPLFNGVVMDLKPASMKGQIEGADKRQAVYPKEGGTSARLILTPLGTGFIKEYDINEFTIKAPAGKGAIADEFVLIVEEPVEYRFKDGQTLRARAIVMGKRDTALELISPKLTDDQGNESKYKINKAIIDDRGITMPSASLVESDSQPNENKKEDDKKEDNSMLKVGKDGIEVDQGDISVSFNLTNGEFKGKTENIEGKVNFFEKTFSFSFGKNFSSDDDKDEEKKEVSEDNDLNDEQKNAVMKAIEKLEETMDKLAFAKEGLGEFFKTGKLPKNEFEGEKNKFEFDQDWPIVPGLTLKAALEGK